MELLQNQLGRQQQYEACDSQENHNPFGNKDYSSDEGVVYQRHERQQNYHDVNVKVDIPEYDDNIQGDIFLD